MPATTALTTVAIANSAARRTACETMLNTYDAARATVSQAREYASCVGVIYPEPGNTTAMKVAVALLLISIAIGAVRGAYKADRYDGPWMGAVMGGVVGAMVALGSGMLLAGVVFVFA